MASPAMFCPVPDRMATWSPNRSDGRTDRKRARMPEGSLLEVSKPTEVLLDLLGLSRVQSGLLSLAIHRRGSSSFHRGGRGSLPHRRRQDGAGVANRGGRSD